MSEYRYCRPQDQPAKKPSEIVRWVLGFLLAFAAGAVVLNLLVTRPFWHPHLGQQTDKLARVRQISDEVEVLFLGTSRVVFAIDPAVFDERLREQGHPTRSFNLAVLDLRAPERDYVLDNLATMRFPKLRYVFIKPALNFTPNIETPMSTRMRYHYNWDTILAGLKLKLDAKRSLVVRLASASVIARQFLLHNANLGVLSDLVMPTRLDSDPQVGLLKIKDGYAADTEEPAKLRSDHFKEELRKAGGKREIDQAGLQAPVRDLSASEIAYLDGMFARVRRLGATPVAFFPPQLIELDQARAVHQGIRRHFPDVPVLTYYYTGDDGHLYDEEDFWMDPGHLSRDGAVVFSRRVADDWTRASGMRAAVGR